VESRTAAREKANECVHSLKRADQSRKVEKVKRARPYGGKAAGANHDELDRCLAALKGNRHGHRDDMVALMKYCTASGSAKLIDLRWDRC